MSRSASARSDTEAYFDLDAFRAARHARGLACPHCGSDRIHRWGKFMAAGRSGPRSCARYRYRCLDCGRTFSDLTGTHLAYLKKLDLWPAHCACIRDTLPIRRVSRRLNISTNTAFRWRHLLLPAIAAEDTTVLRGEIGIGTARFIYSEKGSRRLKRAPRRRGWGERSYLPPVVRVLIARDEMGATVADSTGYWGYGPPHLAAIVGRRLRDARSVACRDHPARAAGIFARSRGLEYRRLVGWDADDPFGLLAYASALKIWMQRFRGVATRYLSSYVAWHLQVRRWQSTGPAARRASRSGATS